MRNFDFENALTFLEMQEFNKKDEAVKKKMISGIGAGAIMVSAMATQFASSGAHTEVASQNRIVQPVKKTDDSADAFSPRTLGGQFESPTGKPLVGTLKKSELSEIFDTKIRPVSKNDIKTITTSQVEVVNGKKTYEPFVTYQTTPLAAAFAPGDGEVVAVSPDVVIKHDDNGVLSYSVIKGIESLNIKVHDTVKMGQPLGKVLSSVKYGIARDYDGKEAFDFIHPNLFVDLDKSSAYRYGNYKYFSQPAIKVSKSADSKTKQILENVPGYAKNSKVLSGVTVDNKSQVAVAEVKDKDFYDDGNIPVNYIEGGTAHVSDGVKKLEPIIQKVAQKEGMEKFIPIIEAQIQQESGGSQKVLETDPGQASQSFNGKIGSIQNPEQSIEQEVKTLKSRLTEENMFSPNQHGDVRMALQEYNFGPGLGREAQKEGVGYSVKFVQEKAKEFYQKAKASGVELSKLPVEWRGDAKYGDFTYPEKIMQYFTPDKNWKEQAQKDEEGYRVKQVNIELQQEASTAQTQQSQASTTNIQASQSKPTPTVSNQQNSNSDVVAEAYKRDAKEINNIQNLKEPLVEALPQSQLLAGKVITLDPGHGGYDTGSLGVDSKETTEKELNLQVALKVKQALENQGAKVVMTRTSDVFVSLQGRVNIAEANKSDAFIAIHNDSSPQPTHASGSTVYVQRGVGNVNDDNQKLASNISQYMGKALNFIPNKGVIGSDLHVLRENHTPANCLIEVAYVNNPKDIEGVKTGIIQDGVANAVTRGVLGYFGVQSTDKAPTTNQNSTNQQNSDADSLDKKSNVDSTNASTQNNTVNSNGEATASQSNSQSSDSGSATSKDTSTNQNNDSKEAPRTDDKSTTDDNGKNASPKENNETSASSIKSLIWGFINSK